MVVVIDPAHPGQLRIADQAYDRTVAGCVSGAGGINPGMIMQQEGSVAAGSFPVALSGRVYCWADASYGAIQAGDLLTTSDTTAPDLQSRIVDRAYAVSLHPGDRHLETPSDGAGSHSESTRFSPISAAGGAGHLYRADESARCAGSTAFDLPAGAPFSPKYCQTRKRFFEQFFFDGAIAEGINGTTVNFGDQTVYIGFALVTFAGEARILAEAGLDTRPSELAIARILAEYDLLDTEAEQVAYGTSEPGFFLRDYVIPPGRPGARPDFSKLGFGDDIQVHSDFGDDAAPGDKDMSQDQALHILVGLWAVKQWAPDQHFDNRSLAEQHTRRLIDFLKRERFLITRPESDDPVDRGADAQSLAGFMLEIAGQALNQDQSSGADVGRG